MEFRQKKRIRKILYSPLVLIFLAIILLLLIKPLWGAYEKARISSSNLEREHQELEKMKAREQTLTSSIEFLRTEQGIESEIRTKFRAVRDGERVAVILPDEPEFLLSSTTVDISKSHFWQKFFDWLFKK